MQTVLSIAIDAFAYGMALFIICIGLSLTMGLMRVVNLAHGAFAMIAGYIASYAARDLGMGYAVAIFLAIIGTVIISIPAGAAAVPPDLRQPRAHPGADDHRHHLLRDRHHQLLLRPDPEDHSAAGQPEPAHRCGVQDHRRASALRHGLRRRGGRRSLVPDREDGFRHQAAGDRRQRGHGRCARRAHAGGLCGQLRHRHRACGASVAWSAPSSCPSSPIMRCATW